MIRSLRMPRLPGRLGAAAAGAVLLLLLLAPAACTQINNPEGWSAGAVAGERLYIGTREGQVRALYIGSPDSRGEMTAAENRELGETVWEFDLRGDERLRAVYGTPAITGDAVYVGGYDGYLYALSLDPDPNLPRQPELIWQERVGRGLDESVYPIVAGPVVSDGQLLVASSDGFLYAYDIAGQGVDETWRFRTGDKIWSRPAVAGGAAFFGSLDKNVYAVNLEDGSELWRYETGGAVAAGPAVGNGLVYVGSLDSVLYALDAEGGGVVWRFAGSSSWYWAEPLVVDGMVLASSLDGTLYALDAATGDLLWSVATDGPIVGTPAVVSDLLALPSDDGRIRVVRLRDGTQLDGCNLGDGVRTSLAAQDEHVYFGVRDNSIRSVRVKPNGNPDEIWVHRTNEDDPLPRGRASSC